MVRGRAASALFARSAALGVWPVLSYAPGMERTDHCLTGPHDSSPPESWPGVRAPGIAGEPVGIGNRNGGRSRPVWHNNPGAARFDLPFLKAQFRRDIAAQAAHIDLRYVLKRAGYSGGVKSIERQTGAGRPSILANLSGMDAVTLWRMADEGEPGALSTLVRYNAEDVASLPRLAKIAITELSRGTPLESAHVPDVLPNGISELPYDRTLVDHLGRRAGYRR